jgi:arabinan endo-1,5-alpha-L-arabinosidase
MKIAAKISVWLLAAIFAISCSSNKSDDDNISSSSVVIESSSSIEISSSSVAIESSSSIEISSSSIVSIIEDSPAPAFADVTVHDPSIFRVNDNSAADKYRIIGSFLGSAKTGDFIKWTLEQSGGTGTNLKYYPKDNPDASIKKVAEQKDYVINRMKTNSTPNPGFEFFASDIHRMPNGKFFHYYSMTSEWMGSIGVAIADAADGNYITQGLFVHHGGTINQDIPPNCIDPQAFFDKTGTNFYMVYGSWSGGIFIYEIDTETGLPKTGSAMNAEFSGYGRKILHSNHFHIEAPYIIYSPDSDYYYLFLSYGGLDAADGYNMRIFRSRNPYGPYEDAQQRAALSLTANNYEASGVKIMGGYQFAQVAGEATLANKIGRDGFLSPGHNSAYYDAETGKYFLIHHTRFVGRGNEHQVRVREMFVNEDGWLLAAPFRYDAGVIRTFSAGQLTGVWKMLGHERDINTTVHTSELYAFNENGSITGEATGTWELGADGKTARITLGGKLYKGVFLRSYDEYHSAWVYAFTALSSDGLALWGATPGGLQ